MFKRFINVFDKNPVVRAEILKVAKEVCGRCSVEMHGDIFMVKVYCDPGMAASLNGKLLDVIPRKSFVVV